jgi:hypothetical protein
MTAHPMTLLDSVRAVAEAWQDWNRVGGPAAHEALQRARLGIDWPALAAELVRLRGDAERYRWVRDRGYVDGYIERGSKKPLCVYDGSCYRYGPDLDAAIDRARKEKPHD